MTTAPTLVGATHKSIYVGEMRQIQIVATIGGKGSPNTGLVSPQFHVVFDDNFEAVPHLRQVQ